MVKLGIRWKVILSIGLLVVLFRPGNFGWLVVLRETVEVGVEFLDLFLMRLLRFGLNAFSVLQ